MKFKAGDRVYFNDTQYRLGTVTSINNAGNLRIAWHNIPGTALYRPLDIVPANFVDYYHDFKDKIRDRLL